MMQLKGFTESIIVRGGYKSLSIISESGKLIRIGEKNKLAGNVINDRDIFCLPLPRPTFLNNMLGAVK